MNRTILFLLASALTLRAATYYCGPSSSGSGSGADFNNLLALPTTTGFSRGNTYVFIEGSYGSRTFQTATSGSTLITVRKATSADSAVAGYASTLHDGVASFGSLTFLSSYWTFSGETRSSFTTGYGVVCSTGSGIQMGQNFTLDVSHITVKYVQLIGTSSCVKDRLVQSIGNHQYITLSHCHLSDAGESVIHAYGTDHMTIEHCYLARNSGDVCDGSQVHSEIIVVSGNNDLTLRYNWIDEPASTAPIATPVAGHPGCAGDQLDVWYIYGNVFTGPGTSGSGMIYIFDCTVGTVYFVNNTIAGLANSSVGTSTSGTGAGCCGTMIARNNLYVDGCERGVGGNITSLTLTHNGYWSSPGAVGGSSTYVTTGSPLLDWQNGNFNLTTAAASAMDAGVALAAPFNTDMFGNTRGGDGKWDRGAIEFSGEPVETPPSITSGNATWTNAVSGSYTVTTDIGASYFNATNLPTGLSISTANGIINGAPSGYTETNVISVGLFASNSYGSDWEVVSFTVLPQSPGLSYSPGIVLYDVLLTNLYSDMTFYVSNSGPSGTTLSGSVSNVTGAFSSQTSADFSLTGTQTKTYTIRYSPTAVGSNYGTAAINSNAGSNYVALVGYGYPLFTGTNWILTNALLIPTVVANVSGNYISTTNAVGAPPPHTTTMAVWGYNQADSTTGKFWGTFNATNASGGSSISFDAASSEHVASAASGETTPHTQGALTDGYVIAAVGTWASGSAQVNGMTYDGTAMTLIADHSLSYYGLYSVKIFGLAVGSKAGGTYNAVMSATGTIGHYNAAIATYNNVLQTESYGTSVDGVGTNTTSALTVSSADGELVLLAVTRGNSIGSPNSGETEIADTQPEADGESSFPDTLWLGSEPGAGSVNIGANFASSQTYVATAVPIKATTNYGANTLYFSVNTLADYDTNLVTILPMVTNYADRRYFSAVGTGSITAPQYFTNEYVLGTTNIIFLTPRETTTFVREINWEANSEVGPDSTAPVVSISAPTNGVIYATSTTPLATLSGTSSDNVGVSSVVATNNTTGLTVTGTTSWSVSNITLTSGTNVITVYASDGVNVGTDSLTVLYTPTVPVSVTNLRATNMVVRPPDQWEE